jgi:hypothetical protein
MFVTCRKNQMQHPYSPDTQPFELALSSLSENHPPAFRDSLVYVSDTIEFAKRILLQHKVKNFTASDVIEVAQMIIDRRAALEQKQSGVGHAL